jgi:hypothetical protein
MLDDILAFLRSLPLLREAVDAITAYPAGAKLALGVLLFCALVFIVGLCVWLVVQTVKRIREVAANVIAARPMGPPSLQITERVEPRIPGVDGVSTANGEHSVHNDASSPRVSDQRSSTAQGVADAPRGTLFEQIATRLPDSEASIGVANGAQGILADQIAAKVKEIEAAMSAVKPRGEAGRRERRRHQKHESNGGTPGRRKH